ncbi:MAG: tRNA (N6-isopentenyl adenosine(37)-C2)-methylthiotransferase MiaB [Proteobacteria bacterium]|nr:tRNA (N6-isopentenyl adenosine(37)-C2)-methylthiotransferase MiaB [Pseudomonadota bacterium]
METEKIFVKTFGCQMNFYDTEKIYAYVQDRYLPASVPEEADVILLNTCSIREKAEQKVYSLLGRMVPLKERKPGLVIGVGGCVAQQEGETILQRCPMVDIVFGTHNIDEIPDIIQERLRTGRRICRIREDVQRVPGDQAPLSAGPLGPTALVTIIKGCDNWCSYCIVPLVRGREVSRPAARILAEASGLVSKGVREITLLGQNVNSYRDPDTGKGFVDLLSRVNDIEGLERLRFVTSHPKDFSVDLAEAMAGLSKVCEHIHLPVQAGSDRVLAAMKRGYTVSQYLQKVDLLRKRIPEVELSTDLIVGFPGEGREDFEKTLDLLREVRYQNAFSFRYSPRPGTRAALMEDPIGPLLRKSWLPELQQVQNRITSEKHTMMEGKEVEVLVEGSDRKDTGLLEGRTRTNYIVHFPGEKTLAGKTAKVLILRSRTIHLEGKVIT